MDKVAQIQQIAEELLEKTGLPAKAVLTPAEEKTVNVQLETDQPGIVIGYHGETLEAFQLMLSMISYRKTGEWMRVLVNVGDYRQRRKESLERMAQSTAQKVKFTGQPQALPPMASFERRIIHMALSADAEVETVSEGEGRERRVVVRPKAEKAKTA